MRVMVIVKATKESESSQMPDETLLTEMGRYNEELVKAGIMLSGEGLHPSSKGVRVRFSGQNRTVIDGPFAETNELIAGFWMWRVKSLDEAIEWVKRCPNPMMSDSEIELRPVFEAEDFGESFTPELREQEAGLRAKLLNLEIPRFEDRSGSVMAGTNRHYNSQTRAQIPAQWQEFASHLGKFPGQTGDSSYGVCWNTKSDCEFDYLTGVEVDKQASIPETFQKIEIPGGRYVVFTHTQHISKLPEFIDTIWSRWVPECGLNIASTPCFERYTKDFNPVTGFGGTELWIPLLPSA